MERTALLASLRDDAAGLVVAGRRADAGAAVPCCPGWTAADLVWHVGEVHDFWGYLVRTRALSPDGYQDPARPDGYAATVEFADASASELHRVLSDTDPATPVWNWTGQDQTAAWVLRRMAHETAVHRVDAERTAGDDHRLDAELAADGLDEFLTYFVPAGRRVTGAPPLAGSVHLHSTDGDGEWTLRAGDDGAIVVTRDHAKADAALRGAANDLLLVLWRRLPIDAVDVFGDEQLAAAFVNDTRIE